MKAIRTHYYGPTNTRGSRIAAFAEGGKRPHRLSQSYDHASSNPHADVAIALARQLGWVGYLIEGGLDNGDCVFVFSEGERFSIETGERVE